MHRFTSLPIFILLASLFLSRHIYASLDNFNLGVGYSGSNELSISADTPGEFDYDLYLRTANNSATSIGVHYNGVNNLQRTLRLSCGTDDSNASDNPNTGTCISGGPFVRGSLVAGNDNQFARAKNFTLFCGTVQVVGEATTQNLISDLYNNSVKDFLDNGASSTWCPTTVTPTPTPSPAKTLVPTKKPTATPKITRVPTKTLTAAKKTPTPTAMQAALTVVTESPVPTVSRSENIVKESGNSNLMLITLGAALMVSILAGVGFLKRNSIKTFLSSLNEKKENIQDIGDQSSPTFPQIENDTTIH